MSIETSQSNLGFHFFPLRDNSLQNVARKRESTWDKSAESSCQKSLNQGAMHSKWEQKIKLSV